METAVLGVVLGGVLDSCLGGIAWEVYLHIWGIPRIKADTCFNFLYTENPKP
jgi:hypothetical protein